MFSPHVSAAPWGWPGLKVHEWDLGPPPWAPLQVGAGKHCHGRAKNQLVPQHSFLFPENPIKTSFF